MSSEPLTRVKRCKEPGCKFAPWRQRLCYRHFREAHGWVFDPERKVFLKLAGRIMS